MWSSAPFILSVAACSFEIVLGDVRHYKSAGTLSFILRSSHFHMYGCETKFGENWPFNVRLARALVPATGADTGVGLEVGLE
jgi:hypothetical protein